MNSKYNLKSIKKEFASKGIFYTNTKLAELMKSYIDVDFKEVYDPTCGDGQLLSVFDDSIKKYGQEIESEQLKIAKEKLKNFEGFCGDTLKEPAFLGKKFECIMANPPFSIKWERPILDSLFTDERFINSPALPPKSKADYAFILHILYYLSHHGIAVVLNFPGILYRGNSEGKIRRWIIEQNFIDKVIRIPGKTFIDTSIETALIVFRKNKINTDIEFIDSENNKKYIASIEDVVKNDYVLSVHNFIHDEKPKIIYDPIELQKKARENMLKRIKSDIEQDKMVCNLEGTDFKEYIKMIESLINSYKLN